MARGYVTRDRVIALLKSRGQGGVMDESVLRDLCREAARMLHRDRAMGVGMEIAWSDPGAELKQNWDVT